MAVHAFTKYFHVVMFIQHFILIMASETSPCGRATWVACGTDTIGTFMVDWESMVKIGW